MTTTTTNVVCDNSSLANFKSWGQAIGAALTTLGWVQTADTGQVNWGTIVAVPSSTYVYEIWRANDALQSSMPIFMRIEYGFSSTSPRIQVTVGTASNGSGTITGQVVSSAPWALTSTTFANLGATTFPCYFSGTSAEFRMMMWATNGANPSGSLSQCTLLVIERSKDTSGNNTADYVTVATLQNLVTNQAGFQQSFSASATGRRSTGVNAITLNFGANSGTAFGTTAAYPVFPDVGKVGNQMLGLMTVYAADVTDQSICTAASMYGSTHTYIAFVGGDFSQFLGSGRVANFTTPISGLMRYE